MNLILKTTADGSHTLYNPKLNEHYHSTKGALAESRHVFIEAGLASLPERETDRAIAVLEVGMGTGLNVLLSLFYAARHPDLYFEMVTLEPHALTDDLIAQINYPRLLPVPAATWFNRIHQCSWERPVSFFDHFSLTKHAQTIQAWNPGSSPRFDIVYYDAFAPGKQADMWETAIFSKLGGLLQPGGLLVTYCASSSFKKALKAAGFRVTNPPGPLGKREMTRAFAP